MTKTAMRIVPDILAIVTVEHGEAPTVIVFRQFREDKRRSGGV